MRFRAPDERRLAVRTGPAVLAHADRDGKAVPAWQGSRPAGRAELRAKGLDGAAGATHAHGPEPSGGSLSPTGPSSGVGADSGCGSSAFPPRSSGQITPACLQTAEVADVMDRSRRGECVVVRDDLVAGPEVGAPSLARASAMTTPRRTPRTAGMRYPRSGYGVPLRASVALTA